MSLLTNIKLVCAFAIKKFPLQNLSRFEKVLTKNVDHYFKILFVFISPQLKESDGEKVLTS
jgi:hypothetical protein